MNQVPIKPARTITLTLLAIAVLAVAGGLSAPTASASSLGPRQEVQQLHQQSGEPALTSLTVTADGTTQPLAPAFSSTVKYYTVVVPATVTQITVAGTAATGDSVAYQETDADTTANGHQVDIPTAGKRLNVVVTRTATAATTTYGVLVIREGPSAADTVALMALYNSAGGETWLRTLNWATAEPINTWADVITDSNGRVTNLRQPNNNMIGTLPDELGSLTELQYLYLNDNQLSGPVPASLANLTKLVDFYLRANDFSGPLPDFSGFTNLRLLELQENKFKGPIPNLSRLTQLQKLWLQDNALSGSIPNLASLTSLTNLSLSVNTLKGSIPSSLSSLTKLQGLDLWANELSGPIPDLSGLTELTYLSLSSNQLTGEIAWLGDLTKLTTVYLWGNELSGPIPDLTGLTELTYVSLSQNKLTGEIPASLGNLTKIVELYLWGNELSGPIPDLRDLSLLFELSLAQNKLEGPVPAWLNGLTNLQGLWLNDNELTGSIPDLRALQKLFQLELQTNQLGGEIPASLGTLSELQILDLRENNLTGQIPDLARLQKLFYLDLIRNQLDGTIPASLAEITGLQYVYLAENQLTGEIPAELGELTKLKGTRFANTGLTGCVPHGLRVLLAAEAIETGIAGQVIPAQDFIAVDANRDGDTDDEGDVPGLNLPFCMLSALTLSDATLDPVFAPNTATYTAESTVASTTVTATLNDPDDQVSIKKGATSYNSVDAIPLEAGLNLITIEVTPSDARLLKQTYTVEVFHPGSAATDRAALIALYNSTGGSGWTNNENWDSAQELGMWFGVAVNGSGRVVGLDLADNNLRGTVRAQLATLTELTSLDLSGNQVSGAIPSELRGLIALESLDLSANRLSNAIPLELGDLDSLRKLYLNDNRLNGPIPAELGHLTNLDVLHLNDNQLTGEIPAELGDLRFLRELYLNDNQLTGEIPAELGALSSLTELSLRNNRLSGAIPASLGNLFLGYARFANNAFTGCVPNGLRHLLTQPEFAPDVPAHDFALDANGDGDTADPGDIAGLTLPFCGLRELTLGGLTLEPAFASDAEAYTASAAHAVTSTTVTATLNNHADGVSITKGADTYADGATVPLDVGPNLIAIEVTASDGSTAPHTYSVTVTRAPNTPPVFGEGAAATRGVDEDTFADQNIGDPLRATDADSADTLTYSLDTASDAFFDIDATTGQLRTEAALDHEARKSYPVTVSVSDGKDANGDADPSADTTITVTILVSDVNEDPSFALANDTRTIAENTPAGVTLGAPFTATDGDGDILTYSLGAGSAEDFEIDAAYGQLRTRAALDHETTSSYNLTVTATDPSADSNSITVTVTVENVEEPGTVALSPVQPRLSDTLSATLTDPDMVSGAVTWSWERSTSRTSGWAAVSGATSADNYTPVDADANYYLRATASYDDGAGDGKSASAVSANPVRAFASGNTNPLFPSGPDTRTVDENEPVGTIVGAPFVATDTDNDRLTYFLSGTDAASFEIDSSSGQLRTRTVLDFETQQSYLVDVTATDPSGGFGEVTVTITVGNVQEAGTVALLPLQPVVGIELTATLADPDGRVAISLWSWERSPDRAAWTPVSGARDDYTPVAADVGAYLRVTATYRVGADTGQTAEAVSAHPVREPRGRHTPVFTDGESTTRGTTKTAPPGVNIGAPVAATDGDNDRLAYSLGGVDAASFDIDESFGQLRTKADLSLDVRDSYTVNVEVTDGKDDQGNPDPAIDATIEVTITVTAGPVRPVIIITGGGGGGSSGPSPSEVDFEWTVKHDIDELESGHDKPTGMWSDGTTLWILENGDGADDAIYAYDLESGERVEDREFELDERNRAPRGVWSNGTTLWVADSGQDKLFAHDLGSGERLPDSDIELAERNADPRGIWADDDTMWVLDGGKDSLFAYNLESGDLLTEYALDSANGDPHGIFFDGVTFWVSDHGAKRLFAYRLKAGEGGEDELERNRDEEFGESRELTKASNNSPRGIWSDGDFMYVADESDDRVYTYNMPDAIDARLASLTLSGVDIGEFSPNHEEYEGVPSEGVTETTIEATTVQRRTDIAVDPPDADGDDANGHQVALEGVSEITVTVTSADGSRTKTYRVAFTQALAEITLDTGWNTFAWPGAAGVAIADALRGDGDLANDISAAVAALSGWDGEAGAWLAFFPALGDVPGVNTLATLEQGRAYWIAVTEPVTWTVPALTTVAGVEVEATARGSAFAGTVTDPAGEADAGLPVEAYVGDTRCNAGEPVATYRALEDGRAVTRYYASVAHADQLAGCAAAGGDVTFRIGDRAVVETGTWDNTAYPWQTLNLTLARETASEETVTIDVAVWRQNEDPFNALADLYISTRAPGESWDTHDDDGALAMTLYTSPRSGARNWYRSELTPVEVVLADGSTVTIDVAVWRNAGTPTSLYISTRVPGEGWITHDEDGALAMTLYTSPRSGAQNWYRSDLTPIEVAVQ